MVFFQLVFLTNVAGMHPAWAGSVLLIARVWDAINDPLIGWLSDHTHGRWGRRLPWMAAAAVPFALSFSLFWFGPIWLAGAGHFTLFVYYSAVALLSSTAATAFALPHSALTAELSHDYDERSRLTGVRMGFSLAGSVGGLVLALAVFHVLDGAPPSVQYLAFGLSVAAAGLLGVGICLWGIWKPAMAADAWRLRHASSPALSPKATHRGGSQLALLFKNQPFLLVCGIYLCSWLAMQFTAGVLPYYVTLVMGLSTGEFHLLALLVQGTALAMIPFWSWVAVRRGKKAVYFYGMAFWLAAQSGLLFLQPGQARLLYALAVIAGLGISVCYLIPNAMLPDVIEWDELKTGRRREGIYYGFCVFLQKVALALGTFGLGQLLAAAGFQSAGPGEAPPAQPETALTAIRWAIGPLPAAALMVGMILAAAFPITKPVHARMVRALARRERLRKRRSPHPPDASLPPRAA